MRPEAGGMRLDRLLAEAVPELSRSRIKSLISSGSVALRSAGPDGSKTISDAATRVKPGQTFAIIIPDVQPARPQAQDLPLTVVHEDEDLIVIDKPAGMAVHPAPGTPDSTLVNALIAHCGDSLSGIGGERRPGIVHRLDKDTSGLIVAAKNDRSHAKLSAQFEDRSVDRAYLAIVWGVPSPTAGEIEGNIGRNPRDRKKMAVVKGGGKHALTRYKVLRAHGTAASLVECRLATGRTHQIRVHLASVGHPVIGDPAYGRATRARLSALPEDARQIAAGMARQALHAYMLGFAHPRDGERLAFESVSPQDISALGRSLELL